MAVLGVAALVLPRFVAIEWVQILAGIALFVAPWVLGFDGVQEPAWNAWIAGPVAALLAGWAIYDARERPIVVQKEREIRYPRAA
jgi:hypothetical protein